MRDLRREAVALAPPVRDVARRRYHTFIHQRAHGRRIVDAHLAGEESLHEPVVVLIERSAQEVVHATVAALIHGVLGERSTAGEDAAPEHSLGEMARLLFSPARR